MITEKFMGDLLIKNYICDHSLVPDLQSLHEFYRKDSPIPFFGLHFICSVYKACKYINSKAFKFSKKSHCSFVTIDLQRRLCYKFR